MYLQAVNCQVIVRQWMGDVQDSSDLLASLQTFTMSTINVEDKLVSRCYQTAISVKKVVQNCT